MPYLSKCTSISCRPSFNLGIIVTQTTHPGMTVIMIILRNQQHQYFCHIDIRVSWWFHFMISMITSQAARLQLPPLFYLEEIQYYYRPQRSCGQGNVFTGVCLSTGGGRVSASVHAGMPSPPGTRQTNPPRMETPPPPGSRLQHMVYERPVRILLECILVWMDISQQFFPGAIVMYLTVKYLPEVSRIWWRRK